MIGGLFITAQGADTKSVNRILLYLRQWDDKGDGDWYSFKVYTSQEIPPEPAEPPITELPENEWAGKSVQDVENFALANKPIVIDWADGDFKDVESFTEEQARLNSGLSYFLIVDDQGMRDQTCIFLDRMWDDDYEERIDRFNKVRVPWSETYSMWINLEIGNMGFEDFCKEDLGMDEDGWWQCRDFASDTMNASLRRSVNKGIRRRNAAIKELEDLGQA